MIQTKKLRMLLNYDNFKLNNYLQYLEIVGGLSHLFSDSSTPYIPYRATEKIYCKAFDAIDKSRSDIAADAIYKDIGVGIKTFTENKNGKSYEKIAEFNKASHLYNNLDTLDKIKEICRLRNERLKFTIGALNVERLVYHTISRNENRIRISESEMRYINLDEIKLTKENDNIIYFKDNYDNYSFNKTKSTLFKVFNTENYFAEKIIYILQEPLDKLKELFIGTAKSLNISNQSAKIIREAIVPLYSVDSQKGKYVPLKSGLNQWHAAGRGRDISEVYIPYNQPARSCSIDFFPRNDNFKVLLPNGKEILMKLCQSDKKGIMSNPNKALGEWILRDGLKLKEGQLATYEMLEKVGVDCVLFTKYDDNHYTLDLKEVGAFEEFYDNFSD